MSDPGRTIGRYGSRALTSREHDVIRLVAGGLKNKEVAESIGTTGYVINNYLRVIYDKIGVWNRLELALWYEHRRTDRRIGDVLEPIHQGQLAERGDRAVAHLLPGQDRI
jgi:DNA-binding CsgD family transcriptional regulator